MIQIRIDNKIYECHRMRETHSNILSESEIVLQNPDKELDTYLRQKMNMLNNINVETWSFYGKYRLGRMEIDDNGNTTFTLVTDGRLYTIKDEDDDWQ